MKNFFNTKKWIGLLAALPPYVPLEPLPGANPDTYNSLGTYLKLLFNILLSIGGMIAVVTLVLGGITYMVSEIADKKSEAKKRMQSAIIGLLLLLSCWLILHEINPNLTDKFILILPGQTQSAVTTPSGTQTAAATTPPSSADFTQCEGAEVPTGKHLTPNPNGSGYICQ